MFSCSMIIYRAIIQLGGMMLRNCLHCKFLLKLGLLVIQNFALSIKMLNVITPSLPSTSKDSQASVDGDGDMHQRSSNLSASLQKLYLWEKKLFEKVKDLRLKKKMRISHGRERKVTKLKHMNQRRLN